MSKCKKCGKEFNNPDNIYCNNCLWHMRWPYELLISNELSTRRKRSHNLKILSLDRDKAEAVFQASAKGKTYTTTLKDCTCKDYALAHGERPCKHIMRLAEELELFNNETFETGEYDYTLETERDYTSFKVSRSVWCKVEAIAKREGNVLSKQASIFLEQGIERYLNENNFTLTDNYKLRERT